MNWYWYSLIALFFTGWYAVAQKWALNLKIGRTQLLTYTFVGLFLCYLIYGLVVDRRALFELLRKENFYTWGLFVAVFSMLGNISQIKALKTCPNPGYVSAIVALQSLTILILSFIIFGSPIVWQKLIGMIILLGGLYGLLLDKAKNKDVSWYLPAFSAMFFWSLMILGVKQMTNLGIQAYQILIILFFLASIGFLILAKVEKISLNLKELPNKIYLPILIAIFVAFFFNLLNFIAIKLVPNPGYSTAVSNAGVLLTLLYSAMVFPKEFGGEFNLRKWISIFVIIVGTTIIILA